MANIVLTDVCNLRCPYCFAGEFVNQDANEISMQNYRAAKEFILSSGESSLGLIGGEPLLHSRFKEILQDVIEDKRIRKATVFTNGIHCDEFLNEFAHEKFRFLINCNPPSDTGQRQYQKLCDNLEEMIGNRYMRDKVSLGINMYKPDFEYDYLIELLEKYRFDQVRVSITVPNLEERGRQDALSYFESIRPRMFEFFKLLMEKGIRPHYDCNRLPACMIREEDYEMLREETARILGGRKLTANMVEIVRCNPVIDILQDLTAIRCFGLSQYTKVPIGRFRSIAELREYYRREVDAYACNTVHHTNCIDCERRLTAKCYGGCLAYKMNDILKLQECSRRQMELHGQGE